jgi:hypothetical protein
MNLRDELVAIGIPVPDDLPIDRWAATLSDAPCKNSLALVGLSTLLFYAAERDHNHKVNDIWDSLIYCSTCISVGYADIFPRTPIGKIIGSALMTIGPALAAKTLDGPVNGRPDEMQQQMLDTLRQILARLTPATSGPSAQCTDPATPET